MNLRDFLHTAKNIIATYLKTDDKWETITNGKWNYDNQEGFVGGKWILPNQSGGYHGLLRQWWDNEEVANADVLLVSENNLVKKHFQIAYPSWKFTTLDLYNNMSEEVDLKKNLCEPWVEYSKYDKIIVQATFEHLYDPVMALKNLSRSLQEGGEMYIHTHVPGFQYHQFPRDYLRFYPDWFVDSQEFVGKLQLKEMYINKGHIFVLFKQQEEG